MLTIGQWVLRHAARLARHWHEDGLGVAQVAVNLSSMQFQSAQFNDMVAQVLQDEGVDGHLIELELTERMLMDDLSEVSAANA
jgi:EAL domain-containing protein (putative c-di-GMP-specific phosphodiesterase class I)